MGPACDLVGLLIAPCSHEAAAKAVQRWHYSRVMPAGKLVKFGVWEDERFVGTILYGRGATPMLARSFHIDQTVIAELVRVACGDHATPVTRMVAVSLKLLRARSPGLRVVLSFADPDQGHVGMIYRAGNWLYLGRSSEANFWMVHGVKRHPRSISIMRRRIGGDLSMPIGDWLRRYVDPAAHPFAAAGKMRYAMPLDPGMRAILEPMAVPFPDAGEVLAAARGRSTSEGAAQIRPARSAMRPG